MRLFILLFIAALFLQCTSDKQKNNHDDNLNTYTIKDSSVYIQTEQQKIVIIFEDGYISTINMIDKQNSNQAIVDFNKELEITQLNVVKPDQLDVLYTYRNNLLEHIYEYDPIKERSANMKQVVNQMCVVDYYINPEHSTYLSINKRDSIIYDFETNTHFESEWDSIFMFFGKIYIENDSAIVKDIYKTVLMKDSQAKNVLINELKFEGALKFVKLEETEEDIIYWLYFKYPNDLHQKILK